MRLGRVQINLLKRTLECGEQDGKACLALIEANKAGVMSDDAHHLLAMEAVRTHQNYRKAVRLLRESIPRENREGRFQIIRHLVLMQWAYRCQICGRNPGDGIDLNAHHIRPPIRGRGTEEPEDLRVLCSDCHLRTRPRGVHGDSLRLVSNPGLNGWACPDDRLRARARAIIDRAGGLIEENRLLGRLSNEAIPANVLMCLPNCRLVSLEQRFLTSLLGDAEGDAPTLFFMTSETWAHWTGGNETEAEARSRAKKMRTWSRNPMFSDRDQPDWADQLLAMGGESE